MSLFHDWALNVQSTVCFHFHKNKYREIWAQTSLFFSKFLKKQKKQKQIWLIVFDLKNVLFVH